MVENDTIYETNRMHHDQPENGRFRSSNPGSQILVQSRIIGSLFEPRQFLQVVVVQKFRTRWPIKYGEYPAGLHRLLPRGSASRS